MMKDLKRVVITGMGAITPLGNSADYFEKNEARKYDLFTHYAVAAAEEAIKNAGLDFEKLNRNKIGVIWGSGNGGIQTFQDQVEEFAANGRKPRFNHFCLCFFQHGHY
jgi:3-oxoacyl-[acyl-carrier-protein] synthase II